MPSQLDRVAAIPHHWLLQLAVTEPRQVPQKTARRPARPRERARAAPRLQACWQLEVPPLPPEQRPAAKVRWPQRRPRGQWPALMLLQLLAQQMVPERTS